MQCKWRSLMLPDSSMLATEPDPALLGCSSNSILAGASPLPADIRGRTPPTTRNRLTRTHVVASVRSHIWHDRAAGNRQPSVEPLSIAAPAKPCVLRGRRGIVRDRASSGLLMSASFYFSDVELFVAGRGNCENGRTTAAEGVKGFEDVEGGHQDASCVPGSDPSTCVAVAFADKGSLDHTSLGRARKYVGTSREVEPLPVFKDRPVTCVVMTPLSFAFVRIGSSDERILGRDVHAEKLCGPIVQSKAFASRHSTAPANGVGGSLLANSKSIRTNGGELEKRQERLRMSTLVLKACAYLPNLQPRPLVPARSGRGDPGWSPKIA